MGEMTEAEKLFWINFIIYLLLTLTSIILMGFAITLGTHEKVKLSILYVLYIATFICVCGFSFNNKYISGLFVIFQLILASTILIMANEAGNVCSSSNNSMPKAVNIYSSSVVSVIASFISGLTLFANIQ